MKRLVAWAVFLLGCLYFLLPLVGNTQFSLKMRRGEYSFDAYVRVFEDPRFWETFGYSLTLAAATIVFGVLLVVPTAYWVRLKLPQARPIIEFITLLPLVIPAIVIVFGYIRLYNTSSWLPLTGSPMGTNILLMTLISFLVGLSISGQTFYSFILENLGRGPSSRPGVDEANPLHPPLRGRSPSPFRGGTGENQSRRPDLWRRDQYGGATVRRESRRLPL